MELRDSLTEAIEELISVYRTTVVEWDASQRDAKRANALFERILEVFKQLRTTQAGRDAITALMDDKNRGVLLTAASHSLAWAPEKAVRVLEEIQSQPGLYAVDAKYTLKSFREGRLKMDW